MSHTFSLKSTLEHEDDVREHITRLVEKWDRLADSGVKGERAEGSIGKEGRVWFDCRDCESPSFLIL